MITVIVPYYQRIAGVLARALTSIGAQRNCPMSLHVIVVDDESPIAAEDEISAAALPQAIELTLIKQRNGGPGAARNTGLDAVAAGTRYIAFLDSDDEWAPDHLERACAALGEGYDFYFADFFQLDQNISAFSRAGRIKPSEHYPLAVSYHGLYGYKGNMFNQILCGNVIGTPTVVYSWAKFNSLRFNVKFKSAGEDYLFWMTAATSGARTAFSSKISTTCGRGVNVFTGAGWGTEGHLQRLHEEIKYRQLIKILFPLNRTQSDFIKASIGKLQLAFTRDVLHRVSKRKKIPVRLLFTHLIIDPMTFVKFPIFLIQILKER